MSDRLKSSLPGLFSLIVLLFFVIATNVEVIQLGWIGYVIDILLLVASWLGIAWLPPELPSQKKDAIPK